MSQAVVLLSGGLDSSTCLAVAVSEHTHVHALSFDYGQRHKSELSFAQGHVAHYKNSEHKIICIDPSLFKGSSLTDLNMDIPTDLSSEEKIPNTYVPARNFLMLAHALSYAESHQCNAIYIGVSSVDYSGYPDCRPEFIQALQQAMNIGTKAQNIQIKTPLLHLSKSQTIALGLQHGVRYEDTVSCYQANAQGEACGLCESCMLRKKGFEDLGHKDPTRYQK